MHDILKVVHRDLKPANLLLDENLRVKVADFGFSELTADEVPQREVQMKGTALYAAPEVWKQEECSKASDVYSFGIILWELYTEEEPFIGYLEAADFYDDVIVKGARPIIPAFLQRSPPRSDSPSLGASQSVSTGHVPPIQTPASLVSLSSLGNSTARTHTGGNTTNSNNAK